MIGAGFSGIGAAIGLRQAGIDDFQVLDERNEVGGTWHANTYPGIAVDIPGFSYSYSFEPFSAMTRIFPAGAELKAYASACVDKHRIGEHLRLGVKVTRARYDERRHLWRLSLSDGTHTTSRFVICATGWLNKPKWPDIPGLDRFGGDVVHTSTWDPALALDGRRVGVIGTGASSVQVVPEIAPSVASLTVFQRTPIWLFPKPDYALPRLVRALFQRAPWTFRAARLLTDLLTELAFGVGFVHHRQFPFFVRLGEAFSRLYLRRQVRGDPELVRKLTPSYGLGCKRPSFSKDYWRTFTRDNVELVTDEVVEITETGVRTADARERALDVIVLATGFHVLDDFPPLKIYGVGGVEMGQFWRSQRFQAYEGSSVKGFPNLWFIVGPYAFTGGSWFAAIDYQVVHAVRVIEEARRRRVTEVAIRPEKHDAWFEQTLRRAQSSVFFNNNCGGSNSYYFDAHGDAPAIRPSTKFQAARRARTFDLDDYLYERAENETASDVAPVDGVGG